MVMWEKLPKGLSTSYLYRQAEDPSCSFEDFCSLVKKGAYVEQKNHQEEKVASQEKTTRGPSPNRQRGQSRPASYQRRYPPRPFNTNNYRDRRPTDKSRYSSDRRPGQPPSAGPNTNNVRCYHCNGMGHYANECSQTKVAAVEEETKKE